MEGEGYGGGEMKDGGMGLIERDMGVVVIGREKLM